ncbi:hypothetical protein J6590_097258 [Homalodisca vitripennis]|nr:hypothetical protein J6590_097258 [Homalodisca vitripennis]
MWERGPVQNDTCVRGRQGDWGQVTGSVGGGGDAGDTRYWWSRGPMEGECHCAPVGDNATNGRHCRPRRTLTWIAHKMEDPVEQRSSSFSLFHRGRFPELRPPCSAMVRNWKNPMMTKLRTKVQYPIRGSQSGVLSVRRFPARWRLRGTVCKSSAVNVRMSVPTASGAQGLGGNWSEFPETGPGSREEREVRSRVPGEDRTLTGGQPGLETAAGSLLCIFCPSSWATGLCEDLIKQNKGESRYSTRSMVLIKRASVTDKIRTSDSKSNIFDRSAIGTPLDSMQNVNKLANLILEMSYRQIFDECVLSEMQKRNNDPLPNSMDRSVRILSTDNRRITTSILPLRYPDGSFPTFQRPLNQSLARKALLMVEKDWSRKRSQPKRFKVRCKILEPVIAQCHKGGFAYEWS